METARAWQNGSLELGAGAADGTRCLQGAAYRAAVASFSPSGNFEQDDSIAWGGVSRAARGQFAKQQNITLNYQMGLEGMSEAKVMTDWPGPGIVYDSNLEEGVQRTFWRHWGRAIRDHVGWSSRIGGPMSGDDLAPRIRDQFSAEQFLFQEAELLDDFKLLDWLLLLDRTDRLPHTHSHARGRMTNSINRSARRRFT